MKKKIKYFFVGLANILFCGYALSLGVSMIIVSFQATKAWVVILAFVIGLFATVVGILATYSLGRDMYRLEEFQKKEKEERNEDKT